jgi:hypothetical protein
VRQLGDSQNTRRGVVKNLPSCRVPYPHICVQATSHDALAIKSNSIDLAEVARQGLQTAPFGDAPDSRRGVVATGDDDIALDLETSNARLMTNENVAAQTCSDIPDSEGRIPRA